MQIIAAAKCRRQRVIKAVHAAVHSENDTLSIVVVFLYKRARVALF